MANKTIDNEWGELMRLEMKRNGSVRITLTNHEPDVFEPGAMRYAQAIGLIVRNAHRDGKHVEINEK